MVGVSRFELEASWSRTKRDTKLRHTPMWTVLNFFSVINGLKKALKNIKRTTESIVKETQNVKRKSRSEEKT